MKWIEEYMGGRQEQRGQMHPLPKGPYLLVEQHKCLEFERHYTTFTDYRVSKEFKLEWGFITYVAGFDGPIRAGHYLDTSD